MFLPTPSFIRGGLRSARIRPNAARVRPQRAIPSFRRGYASEGEHQAKGSEIPWLVGSIVLTVPAASWLLSQTPKKEAHGGHDSHGEEHKGEEAEQSPPEDDSEKGEEDSKPEKEESTDNPSKDVSKDDQPKDDGKDSDSSEEKGDDKGKGDDSKSSGDDKKEKDPKVSSAGGEPSNSKSDKADKSKLDSKRESANPISGAQHPYLDDENKSTKKEGIKETAKIHGTVDSSR